MQSNIITLMKYLNEINQSIENWVKEFQQSYSQSEIALMANRPEDFRAKELILLFDRLNKLEKKLIESTMLFNKDNIMFEFREKLNTLCDTIHQKKIQA